MDGWRPLHSVAQLKWSFLASGQAVMNETDLATLILNMLIKMCEFYPSRCVSREIIAVAIFVACRDADNAVIRPLPRIKRYLSEATCLPHIVQVNNV